MFRVIMHTPASGDHFDVISFASTPLKSWLAADEFLVKAVDSGFAIGGGIERLVPGIGWCVCNEQPEESEVIQ